jgi:hypothetical protein
MRSQLRPGRNSATAAQIKDHGTVDQLLFFVFGAKVILAISRTAPTTMALSATLKGGQ